MITTKADYYKKLESLKSWKEFALTGVVKNVEVANKIDIEIFELKDRYDYLAR